MTRIATADKDVRAEARILTDRLGFTFDGYTSSGHLRFVHHGVEEEIRLAATPSTRGWIRTHRQRVARALGISRRELEHVIAGDRKPGTGHIRAPKRRVIRGVCPTGKTGYESRAKARKSVRKMKGHKARRAYECDLCGLWHLTKQAPRSQRPATVTPLAPERKTPSVVQAPRTPAEVRARINALMNEARAVSRSRSGPGDRPPRLDDLRAELDELRDQLHRLTLEAA